MYDLSNIFGMKLDYSGPVLLHAITQKFRLVYSPHIFFLTIHTTHCFHDQLEVLKERYAELFFFFAGGMIHSLLPVYILRSLNNTAIKT